MTNAEKMRIIKDMVIIVDTREVKWQHIQEYFDENEIKYKINKVDTGDYTFILPNYPELDMDRKILIERKGSIDELGGNFTVGRERVAREFERVEDGQTLHLVLENFTWRKVLNGSYRSKFNPKAYKGSLIGWCIKYRVPYHQVVKQDSGEIIYEILKKELEYVLNNL